MSWIITIPVILILSSTAVVTPVSATGTAAPWRAYVCRVTDWVDCEQGRNNKRIYPDETLYTDKDTCLYGFEARFKNDPAISGKYPQTSDPAGSYVFDCEMVN
jgi:hypothetical protein